MDILVFRRWGFGFVDFQGGRLAYFECFQGAGSNLGSTVEEERGWKEIILIYILITRKFSPYRNHYVTESKETTTLLKSPKKSLQLHARKQRLRPEGLQWRQPESQRRLLPADEHSEGI